MTVSDASEPPAITPSAALFAVTVFSSALLVFTVQPMVTKLVLPLLGGSPSVWNTGQVFFQAALLAGYGYAHAMQRVSSLRLQAAIHITALVVSALVLPLQVSGLFGEPSSNHPALWLIGVLTVSVGAPFAVLSATAPLVQAWHARVVSAASGREPYALYAASNVGSLLALLAYPALIEPTQTLRGQTLLWSLGYGGFVLLIGLLALFVTRRGSRAPPAGATAIAGIRASAPKAVDRASAPTWRRRGLWVLLAATPSSLMLGVTTHITMDVASAPLLWVVPLALYLLTFVIAFRDKPLISEGSLQMFQAAALAGCVVVLPFAGTEILLVLALHLGAFFLTALMCHQALVARRPDPSRLTEFYFWMSLGGVLGGAFNALLAPVIFSNVWEYQLVLSLSCLVRPWGRGGLESWRWAALAVAVVAALAAPVVATFQQVDVTVKLLLGAVAVMAFILRNRALAFFCAIVLLTISATAVGDRVDVRQSSRNFFGVLRQSEMPVPALGGAVRMLSHGTTLHGAQALDPRYRCRPLVYYAPETPIGQVFSILRAKKEAFKAGAVGLGTGSVAAYTRPGDQLTFFEINPLVIRISSDPERFSYTTRCAKGAIGYVLGDARLTLARQPDGAFDVLLIDAFSSDSVPAHLLTVEALKGYLQKLKPDGLLILHLSNRHLELNGPAMAAARAAGGVSLLQQHDAPPGSPPLWESSEDVVLVAKSADALAAFKADRRWGSGDPNRARPWTDDYMNLVGAMYARWKVRWAWLP